MDMRSLKQIGLRILLINGEVLLGLTFVIGGMLIVRLGILSLLDLWAEFMKAGPFSLPSDATKWISASLPLISHVFIRTVSSICAVLVGGLWLISGVMEAYEARHTIQMPSNFHQPGMVAESLRASKIQNWRSPPRLARIISLVWPKARFMSPVSYGVFDEIFWSLWKLLFLGIAIAGVGYLCEFVSALLRSSFRWEFGITVPSFKPLYGLLFMVAVVNGAIAVSLIPFRTRSVETGQSSIAFRGHGEPHVFLALVEEGCRLLSPRGQPHRGAIRLEMEGNTLVKGSLVENAPFAVPSIGRPAAYVCLPLILILMVTGFSRLISFTGPASSMPYQVFLARYALQYLLEVAFSLGLILCGLHFANWARKLFAGRSFRSFLVFCSVIPAGARVPREPTPRLPKGLGILSGGTRWAQVTGVDEQLATWARTPGAEGEFRLESCWAEAVSEAAAAGEPRFLIGALRSQALDRAVSRIMELPFHVRFERHDGEDDAKAQADRRKEKSEVL